MSLRLVSISYSVVYYLVKTGVGVGSSSGRIYHKARSQNL